MAELALSTRTPCTALERELGIAATIYFFLGCAAYPEGDVAILCKPEAARRLRSSFWPFDTGGIATGRVVPSGGAELPEEDKRKALQSYWGSGAELGGFSTEYLGAHFADPREYARRGQEMEPDFPPYHGFVSVTGDRRAWTIEVQIHEPLSLKRAEGLVQAIVVQRHQLLADLPDELTFDASVASDVFAQVRNLVERSCEGSLS
jgi:hypothetical protein